MGVVVADASPLRYLVLIGAADVLPALFGEVLVPVIVGLELTHAETPTAVRNRIELAPSWLNICEDRSLDPAWLPKLDAGERAAIALAQERAAELILMDDRAGVLAARALGFTVLGTIGVLALAARRGVVDLERAFTQLRMTNFRVRAGLLDSILAASRQGGP